MMDDNEERRPDRVNYRGQRDSDSSVLTLRLYISRSKTSST
jgi:hypothetical protein